VSISGIDPYPHGGEFEDDDQQSFAGAERVIHHIVDSAVKVFRAKPKFVDRAFPLLSRSERDVIKRILKDAPLEVVHGYPNETHANKGAKAVASIIIGNESLELAFLDSFAFIETPETHPPGSMAEAASAGTAVFGELDTAEIGIWIWTTHPDLMLYYYNLVWAILIGGHKTMLQRDVDPISITGGDLRPDPQFLPLYAYIRRIALKVRGLRTSAVDSALINEILIVVKTLGIDSETIIGPIQT
jgi:hypothetical protein